MISKFFIDRPVLAAVLSIILVLAGAVCMITMPVARLPEISPPTVNVTAIYPGASAETVALSLAAPIEQQISGAEHMLYYDATCSNDGSLSIICTFDIGTDLDLAAVDIQNRVSRAQPLLPQEAVRQGITVQKVSADLLAFVELESDEPRYDELYLSNYATINLLDPLKRVKGVGDAQVFGAKDYSMRIWVDPSHLTQKALTVADVASAIREQNGLFAAGRIGQSPSPKGTQLTMPVITRGRLQEPADFENIVIRKGADGSMLRLKDIGRAELGSKGYDQTGRLNGKSATFLLFYLQPGANSLDAVNEIGKAMETLSKSFPPGIRYKMPYDTTKFIAVSIEQVVHTLLEAILLVLVVVFVFLQSWRATLIPLLAVPVAIIGTFIGMKLLGFSTNTLTLFGMVLAIGIVVDDAIVVVENVERIMHDEGLPPREATIKAMEQVTGPVIAIVLVLAAVFVPVAFLGGLTGQMYKQFAVTIAISVAISGFVALTLSPVLCVMLLRPTHKREFIIFRWFNSFFNAITFGYATGVRYVIKFGVVSMLLFGGILGITYHLFQTVPSGFLPDEDQGYFITIIVLPEGASLERTDAVVRKVEAFLLKQPEIENVGMLEGLNFLANSSVSSNAAAVFGIVKPWNERPGPEHHIKSLVGRTWGEFGGLKEALVIAINPPSVPGLGFRAGFEMQLENRGGSDVRLLANVTQKFVAACNQRKELAGVTGAVNVTQPQVYIDLDADETKALGISMTDIYDTLQAYLGAFYVNDFIKFGHVYRVQLQAEPQYRSRPEDIGKIFVRSGSGKMIPLSEIMSIKFQAGPNIVTRFNGNMSAKISGAPGPGYSTGDAIKAIGEVARDTLPPGFAYEWSGATYQEIKAGSQAPFVITIGLIVVFLVLAAQYEAWSLPFAVMLAVPLGAFGSLIAVSLRGFDRDIFFQIGLLTLVGLAAKNAILIVEFCVHLRKEGKTLTESAIEAARLRFRPILMTSLAFILGVMPLVFAKGAGAGGQQSIGTGVMGGMIAATVLAVFFVPLFFVIIQGISEFFSRKSGKTPPSEKH